MGDFNIDLNNKNSPMFKELMSTTLYWGLKSCITGVTRLGTVNGVLKGSCIDNIFSNSDNIMRSGIVDWNFSDHQLVVVKRKRSKVMSAKVSFQGRSYKNYVKEDMQRELLQGDWDDFYGSRDPSYCWSLIENMVKSYLNRSCPMKNFKVKEVREVWVTNEILEEIKDKDLVVRIAKRTGRAEDWIRAKIIRNRVGRPVEQAKADFLKEQQAELEGDPKKFWRLVKSIVPGKKSKTGKILLVNTAEDGETNKVANENTADFINTFFSGIGAKLAKNNKTPWRFYGEKLKERCPPLRADFELTQKLCKEIETAKSSGFSDISTKVFKDAFIVIIPQLVYLFNLSFDTGIFPDSWKVATVIPLYKGGDKSNVGNFRPVSLLPIPGKLLEKIAHNKLSTFLNNHGVISDKQGGFWKRFFYN